MPLLDHDGPFDTPVRKVHEYRQSVEEADMENTARVDMTWFKTKKVRAELAHGARQNEAGETGRCSINPSGAGSARARRDASGRRCAERSGRASAAATSEPPCPAPAHLGQPTTRAWPAGSGSSRVAGRCGPDATTGGGARRAAAARCCERCCRGRQIEVCLMSSILTGLPTYKGV